MLKRHINYKGNLITYYIIKSKNKNITLKISPSGELHLHVPQKTPISQIEELMQHHVRALYNRWQYVEQHKTTRYNTTAKAYTTGDEIRILGKLYPIRWEEASYTKVSLDRDELIIHCPDNATAEMRLLAIKNFLRHKAQKVFSTILDKVYPRFSNYDFPLPQYTIREMKTRWGSCSYRKGKISLNLCLMQVPLKSIEAVIVHELCHFIQPNHSQKFYALMDKHMPDWKKHNKTLDALGNTHHW